MGEEFLKLWSELSEVLERARAEARMVALRVAMRVRERYWDVVERVAGKHGLEPRLGLESNGDDVAGYRPVLYLLSDGEVDPGLAYRIREELGEWVSDARLKVVVMTRRDAELLKLELI
jgi:hypothetical protein